MGFDHKSFRPEIRLPNDLRQELVAKYIALYKDEFPEWYMPINLGERHKIPARTYPSFQDQPDSFSDNTRGFRKWDLIIRDNLPELRGKTVCDIGSNCGIFSLEMANLGAKLVDGYDRGAEHVQANNHHLGVQSVPQQAYMVRNLYEMFYGMRYNHVNFIECDLMKLDFTNLKYDLFFSCCTLYHLGEERMRQVIKDVSNNIPEIFLQANNGHGGELGRISSLEYQTQLLVDSGYKVVKVDAPAGYVHPVIYATK